MAIEKLSLSNFQSHKRTVLPLHRGVNCVIGSSDVGKTAIIRALRWLIWNRPLTVKGLFSWWGGDTSVSIETNGHQIERLRAKENAYVLDGKTLSAIRSDVPEEIRKALNMDEVNLQMQFDRPFLISASPGEVAHHFNTIAHIEKISSSTKVVQSWIRQIERDIETDRASVKELRSSLKEFRELDALDERVQELEGLDSELRDRKKQLSGLQSNVTVLKRINEQITDHSRLMKLADPVDKLIGQYGEKKTLFSRRTTLNLVTEDLNRVESRLASYQHLIDQESAVENLLELWEEVHAWEREKAGLKRVLTNLQSADSELEAANKSLARLEQRFHKEFPDVCPLCGRKKGQ